VRVAARVVVAVRAALAAVVLARARRPGQGRGGQRAGGEHTGGGEETVRTAGAARLVRRGCGWHTPRCGSGGVWPGPWDTADGPAQPRVNARSAAGVAGYRLVYLSRARWTRPARRCAARARRPRSPAAGCRPRPLPSYA